MDVICDGFVYFRLWPKSLVNFGGWDEENYIIRGVVVVHIDLVNSLLLILDTGRRRFDDIIDGALLFFARVVAETAVRAFLTFARVEDEYKLAHVLRLGELCKSLCRCNTLLTFNAVWRWWGAGRRHDRVSRVHCCIGRGVRDGERCCISRIEVG